MISSPREIPIFDRVVNSTLKICVRVFFISYLELNAHFTRLIEIVSDGDVK